MIGGRQSEAALRRGMEMSPGGVYAHVEGAASG